MSGPLDVPRTAERLWRDEALAELAAREADYQAEREARKRAEARLTHAEVVIESLRKDLDDAPRAQGGVVMSEQCAERCGEIRCALVAGHGGEHLYFSRREGMSNEVHLRVALDAAVAERAAIRKDLDDALVRNAELVKDAERWRLSEFRLAKAARWLLDFVEEEGLTDEMHEDDDCPQDGTCTCPTAVMLRVIPIARARK